MQDRSTPYGRTTGRPLEESRGGWAFFGRLLTWSMRNNFRGAER